MIMCHVVDRQNIIPVDEWGMDKYPILEQDVIFKNIKGEIILPIAEFFGADTEESKQLDYFAMNTKRSYNSDKTREHICQYMNYFEKFYDYDKELLMIIYDIKFSIDYMRNYSVDNFMDDINRLIIRNSSITRKITHFVDDNYNMKLSNNGGRTPNLQFNNSHAKILYEISMMMNMYIPLATHYMYMHMVKQIKQSTDVQDFMLQLFDMCIAKYEEEQQIYIYDKIYETALSVVNKSKNPDKKLWDKNFIRGNNPTTHTKDSVVDVILQIMPKYTYDNNIINFNYFSNRKSLQYKITDIAYEFSFTRLSSSERDADQNSEYDKYEARLNKRDEALALQNKVAAEQAALKIEALYGPFSDEEVEHYKKVLTRDGSQIINKLTNQLVGYAFYREMGDPITWKNIPSSTDYIKLMIAAKRKYLEMGMVILPHIMSSKVIRLSSRKVVSKNNAIEIKNAALYEEFRMKYNNPKIQQIWFELLGTIKSSSFEIIDWDSTNNAPSAIDGKPLPMVDDMIDEEMLVFAIRI